MSTETERLVVLEKVVSALIDRIDRLTVRTEELSARVAELEENSGGSQKFNMSSDASLSLFEKMFPTAAAVKKANADAATLAGVTTTDGVGGKEYIPDMNAPENTIIRHARVISRQ